MMTVNRAKEVMRLEKNVFFGGRRMKRIVNLVFSFGNIEDIICSAEVLELDEKTVLRVPLEFLKEDDSLDYIDAIGHRKLKYLKSVSLEMACKVFTDIDKVKFIDAQDGVQELIRSLLEVEEELSVKNKNNREDL